MKIPKVRQVLSCGRTPNLFAHCHRLLVQAAGSTPVQAARVEQGFLEARTFGRQLSWRTRASPQAKGWPVQQSDSQLDNRFSESVETDPELMMSARQDLRNQVFTRVMEAQPNFEELSDCLHHAVCNLSSLALETSSNVWFRTGWPRHPL